MILVDTNVLIDLLTGDPDWAAWAEKKLDAASLDGPIAINDIIYAELAVRYERIEGLDVFIRDAGLILLPLSRDALFMAAKAHLSYRRAGGTRTGVLCDFFIGAQGISEGIPLLTRDTRRYRTYFPQLALIAPDM